MNPEITRWAESTRYAFGGQYAIQVVRLDSGEVTVQLPHQCDEWAVAYELSPDDAVAQVWAFQGELNDVAAWIEKRETDGWPEAPVTWTMGPKS